MTTANKVTIIRILLVPFFIVQVLYYIGGSGEWHRFLAVLAFGLAAFSDAVDGYIARRYHQQSELGALLDPLADKLLLVSGILLLSLHQGEYLPRLPLYLTVTVLSRDVLLFLGVLLFRYVGVSLTVRPHWTGKAATVLQMACILYGLLKLDSSLTQPWLPTISLVATVCTGISGAIYLWAGTRQLSAHPASSAQPRPEAAQSSGPAKPMSDQE